MHRQKLTSYEICLRFVNFYIQKQNNLNIRMSYIGSIFYTSIGYVAIEKVITFLQMYVSLLLVVK